MFRLLTLCIVLACKSNALQEKRNTLFPSNSGKLRNAASLSLLEDLKESATEAGQARRARRHQSLSPVVDIRTCGSSAAFECSRGKYALAGQTLCVDCLEEECCADFSDATLTCRSAGDPHIQDFYGHLFDTHYYGDVVMYGMDDGAQSIEIVAKQGSRFSGRQVEVAWNQEMRFSYTTVDSGNITLVFGPDKLEIDGAAVNRDQVAAYYFGGRVKVTERAHNILAVAFPSIPLEAEILSDHRGFVHVFVATPVHNATTGFCNGEGPATLSADDEASAKRCEAQCTAAGHCCNNPNLGFPGGISCAQACFLRSAIPAYRAGRVLTTFRGTVKGLATCKPKTHCKDPSLPSLGVFRVEIEDQPEIRLSLSIETDGMQIVNIDTGATMSFHNVNHLAFSGRLFFFRPFGTTNHTHAEYEVSRAEFNSKFPVGSNFRITDFEETLEEAELCVMKATAALEGDPTAYFKSGYNIDGRQYPSGCTDVQPFPPPTVIGSSVYSGCKSGGVWVRPFGDVTNDVAGVESCRDQCKAAGYEYYGLECPRATVHCQCSNGDVGTLHPDSECKEFNKNSGRHCIGPFTAGPYFLGAGSRGSVYKHRGPDDEVPQVPPGFYTSAGPNTACANRDELGVFSLSTAADCQARCDAEQSCVSFEMNSTECRLSATCLAPSVRSFPDCEVFLKWTSDPVCKSEMEAVVDGCNSIGDYVAPPAQPSAEAVAACTNAGFEPGSLQYQNCILDITELAEEPDVSIQEAVDAVEEQEAEIAVFESTLPNTVLVETSCFDKIANGDEVGVDCGGSCPFECAPEPLPAGINGDPHFAGFDGSRYDFQGVAGEVFNLITDSQFQFNARFIANPDYLDHTYLGVVGLMIGSHKLIVTPDLILLDDDALDEGRFTLAGKEGRHEVGLVRVSKNAVVVLGDSFTVSVNVLHKDAFAHLNIDCTVHSDHLTNPHGLLGQTARYLVTGDDPSPVVLPHSNKDAAGFIEGQPEDYIVSDGLLGTNFPFNRFGISQQKKSGIPRRFSYAHVHKAQVNL